MASIRKFHVASCPGKDCSCLWVLDYRPLGLFGPRRRVRFKTRKQAERFQVDTAQKASRGEYVEPSKVPTFGEVAEDWYRSKLDRRPSHTFNLRTRLDKQILPVLGKQKLDRITVEAVEKLRDKLREEEYAHRTINRILWIVGAVFRLAIKRGQYSRNPLDSVERAVQPAREICTDGLPIGTGTDAVDPDSVLSPKEIRTLLQEANPGFERTLFGTAYLTGARQGELLALRWIDLELPKEGSGKIVIRRSLSWARPQGEEIRPRYFPPKTIAGRRTISIPALLVAELKRWKFQCPIAEDGLVFPGADGRPMPHAKMLQTQFYPALSRAKLRRVTFHTLRHSCASSMIASGAPITEVQHRLGHANPAITLLVYSHFMKHSESDVAEQLANQVLDVTSAPRTNKEIGSAVTAIAS